MTDQQHDMPEYSAADMEKYWQGLLSPAEMHALEKAALDDPFLADALEGYRHLATAQPGRSAAQLAELQQRLERRTRLSEKRPASISWWKPAVAAMLIIGTGTLGFLFLHRNSSTDREVAVVPVQKPDTINPMVVILPPAKDSAILLPKDVAVLKPKTYRSIPQNTTPTQAITNDVKAAPGLADSNPEPAPDAVAAAEKPASRAAVPDSSSIARNDRKNEEALGEVVVTGYGNEKKRSVSRKETLSKNLSVEVQNAVPVKGWTEYNQYLKEQAIVPDSLLEVHGQVVLTLDVKSNGKLTNIVVQQSLHPVLDEEAERLVKEGPAWKVLKGRKASVYVIVPF
jgi:hypothetical protein